jgi:hypothetical protein
MDTGTTFKKAGECLYRNPSSGTYFALVKVKGKQFRQSLRTNNLPEARRKLADFKRDLERVDPDLNRKTLDSVVDLYLGTMAGQALGTIKKKKQIGALIKTRWKGVLVRSIKKSDILSWLASFPFGTNTRNKYLRIVRAIFQLAVDDKVIAYSPLLGVKEQKVPQPIRKTPTMAEFRDIPLAFPRRVTWFAFQDGCIRLTRVDATSFETMECISEKIFPRQTLRLTLVAFVAILVVCTSIRRQNIGLKQRTITKTSLKLILRTLADAKCLTCSVETF